MFKRFFNKFKKEVIVLSMEDFNKLVEDNERRKELIELCTREELELIKENKWLKLEIERLQKMVVTNEN